ncbi:MAG: tetratricopeptide repeat protein [bacterium]
MLRPIRGRGAEIEQACRLLNAWLDEPRAQAESSETKKCVVSMLIVSGQPGLGKSRFTREVARRLSCRSGLRMLEHRCQRNPSWISFIRSTTRMIRREGSESAEAQWRAACHSAAGRPGYAHCSDYCDLASVFAGIAAAAETQQPAADLSRESLEAVAQASLELAAATADEGLCLFLDDLQWLGELESDLQRFIAGLRLQRDLLILATIRVGHASRLLELAPVRYTHVELKPLDLAAGDQILRDVLGSGPQAEDWKNAHDIARGNPLLYEQLGGLLQLSQGTAEVEDAMPGGRPAPGNLQRILLLRLAKLPDSFQRLVQLLAVAGADMPRRAMLDLHHRLESGNPPASVPVQLPVQDDLASLVQEFNLEHDEVRAVIADSLPAELHCRLQRAVAGEIRRRMQVGSATELDDLRALISHLDAAGEREELHQRQCEMLMLLLQTGRGASCSGLLEQARASAPDPSPQLLRIEAFLRAGQLSADMSRDLLEQALAHCGGEAWTELRGRLHGDIANLHAQAGGVAEAIVHYDRSIAELQRAGSRRSLGIAMANLGILLHRQGRFEDARERYEEALRIAGEQGNLRSRSAVLGYLATLYLDLGNMELARAYYEEAIALHERLGDLAYLANSLADYGNMLREQGLFEEALASYRRALGYYSGQASGYEKCVTLYNIGRLHKLQGNPADAEASLRAGLNSVPQGEANPLSGIVLAELGDAICQQGRPREAVSELRRALELSSPDIYPLFRGQALCYLVRALQRAGEPAQARALLQEARQLYNELGEPQDLDFLPELMRVEQELDESEGAIGFGTAEA